jgi:glycosyltransferase involved in cell wall biosynthesis
MNVLMLGWELPPYNSGGLGEACLGLSKALSKKGIHVTFVLPQKVDISYDFMDIVFANISQTQEQIQAAYLTYQEWLKNLGEKIDSVPADYVSGALKYAERVRDIASKLNADIIHTHDWLTYPAGMVAKEVIKKPLVAHVHATEFDRTGGHYPNPIVYSIEKRGMEYADRVISVSQFTKNIVINNYNINPGKISVVHNGIEEISKKHFPPALSAMKEMGYKVVLYLGRITLQKGPEYFVRAAKRVTDYEDKVIFVVTGSGDMQEQMMNEAAYEGLLDKMVFTGFLRGEERDQIYQTADLYVMPSVSEPFGITPLEAVVNGTPVLVSKQSGVSEVLRNALKVDFWDTEEMANKIIAVLKYSSLKLDLKKESSKELPNVTWEKSAEKCIGVYNQLI